MNHPFLFVLGSVGFGLLAQVLLTPFVPAAGPPVFLAAMGAGMVAAARKHRVRETVRRAAQSLAPAAHANPSASTSALAH